MEEEAECKSDGFRESTLDGVVMVYVPTFPNF